MNSIAIDYKFTLEAGETEVFELRLDPRTLELQGDPPTERPNWTDLEFEKCANCPLSQGSRPDCPAATRLIGVVGGFAHVLSHASVDVEVTTAERTVSRTVPAQQGISSVMGLIMAVSGCPRTTFLRPMARFHLPFASEEETIYRASSMFLLSQYFQRRKGRAFDLELGGLTEAYKHLRAVNASFANRLRAASEHDSSVNAIVVLDTRALVLPLVIEDSLEEIEYLFGQDC